ncbi:pentapeptide repeat-containing protein [Flavobacterium cerinum]|uniref:Pentapeptide repeat-containing protein n=1 Tax=Flavobacterium cerinum TaxID=2502784 RepID=A0ABY5IMT7_9FLAO|nr:pentapeptide repeat-containing protein [Flavobacterium cerinum]UUC44160.1 pentapeptide repeat-containing protein [Flavobacterium cerinum]
MSTILFKRWEASKDSVACHKKIVKKLQSGSTLSEKETIFKERINGYLDYRGIHIGGQTIKKNKLKNIDFSESYFAGAWIEKSEFINCIFDKTDFTNFSDHGNIFKGVLFERCKFTKAAMGYNGSKFENCIFRNCDFTRSVHARAEYNNCEFINCKLKGIDFSGSSFEDCVFEGKVEDVWFRGGFPSQLEIEDFGRPRPNKMKNVSFEHAELIDLTISDNCDLSTVKVPNDCNYLRLDNWKARLERLDSCLASLTDDDKKGLQLFIDVNERFTHNQDWMILNREELEKRYGLTVALVIFNELSHN